LQLPLARQVAIDEVCDACVGEEEEGGCVLVVQQEVGSCWSGDKAGCCQEVGDVVNVLVFRTSATGESGTNGRCGGFGAFSGGLKCGG